jgi:hypothetical protein
LVQPQSSEGIGSLAAVAALEGLCKAAALSGFAADVGSNAMEIRGIIGSD